MIWLIVPFLLQLGLVAGLVGTLSFSAGRTAVNDVARRVRNEITLRVQEHLETFLKTPRQINRINADALRQGLPGPDDPEALEHYFWKQIQVFPTVTSLYFGTPDGGLVDAGREGAGGPLYVIATDNYTRGPFRKFATDRTGRRTELLTVIPDFDARKRSWYRMAVDKRGPVWSDIFILFTGQDLSLAASRPVYGARGELLGVMANGIFLSHISEFLQGLEIGRTGQCFIMERNGRLVAASTHETTVSNGGPDKTPRRRHAHESDSPMIRGAARFIADRAASEHAPLALGDRGHFTFDMDGERHFLQISPIRDHYGIDWRVVVVIPEADFMADIHAGLRTTIALVAAAMLVALLVGIVTAGWVTRPVHRLNASTQALARGEWREPGRRAWISEIDQLAESFARMARRLNASLDRLQAEVAERSRAESEVRERERHLRSIFEAADHVAFITVDADEAAPRVTGFSPGAERIFGHHAESVIGQPVDDLRLTRAPDHWTTFLAAMRAGETPPRRAVETTLVRRSGEPFDALFSTHPLGDDAGSLSGAIGVAIDISRRKQAEAELRKMEKLTSIGTLAGGIAHDFNNILMGIFGSISLARTMIDPDHPAGGPLDKAEAAMNRATRLTRQLLTFSKGGAPVRESISLARIVETVVRFDLSGGNVKLELEANEALWPARADIGQIQQVFSNLAINAAQAMPDGGRLRIRMENREITGSEAIPLKPGKYIRTIIRDEGLGIPKAQLSQIFDPYYSTKPNGSGLGLATVFSIVNRHGGHIAVDSTPGEGTRFTIHLPAADTPSPAANKSRAPVQEPLRPARKARILIMDDEEMIRTLGAQLLARIGHEVETAADGHETVDRYREAMSSGKPFDLVIMDLTIPGGMGGRKAVQALLAIDPEAKAVVSTGYADDPVMADPSAHGFAGIIPKPYTQDQLKSVIDQVLNADSGVKGVRFGANRQKRS
jgi:PAS domain S-box-containing protein